MNMSIPQLFKIQHPKSGFRGTLMKLNSPLVMLIVASLQGTYCGVRILCLFFNLLSSMFRIIYVAVNLCHVILISVIIVLLCCSTGFSTLSHSSSCCSVLVILIVILFASLSFMFLF